MGAKLVAVEKYVDAIRQSGLTIYDSIEAGHPELWIPLATLEQLLSGKLTGISLAGLPLRTRSKVVKEHVCRALGYPVPTSFRKVQPRFPGQNFDTYIQKSSNLQVWNEQLVATRRYAIIHVDSESVIDKTKVVTGKTLALRDATGTLTQKFQARLVLGQSSAELVSEHDTLTLRDAVQKDIWLSEAISPASDPTANRLLSIGELFKRLRTLLGTTFADAGFDQERNRGTQLHRLVCQRLGYSEYREDGQFPDIRNQLLEVKLQTSQTIDLGLVRPDSKEVLDVPCIEGEQVRHCDVRYALFYATIEDGIIALTHIFLTTGASFFARFPQFKGKVLNKKLQIKLPVDFFD